MRIGTAASLYRYPVKGLRGESLPRADVLVDGFARDRTTALFVETPDHARAGKTYRGKEQARLHTVDAIGDARSIAAAAGVSVVPDASKSRYFDSMPISIVFDSWLDELAAVIGRPVEALRFRPNIVVAASAGFHGGEGALLGACLRIGRATFNVMEPITRCVTPTYDLATGERDPALARAIAAGRNNLVGVYCTVAEAGTIAVGDGVEQIEG